MPRPTTRKVVAHDLRELEGKRGMKERILGDIGSEDPGNEACVVAHAFDYRKPYLLMRGMPVEITGDQALARHRKAAAYWPSLEEQV